MHTVYDDIRKLSVHFRLRRNEEVRLEKASSPALVLVTLINHFVGAEENFRRFVGFCLFGELKFSRFDPFTFGFYFRLTKYERLPTKRRARPATTTDIFIII